jgi:trimethylamine:corrinoid methyltransferase-like protein
MDMANGNVTFCAPRVILQQLAVIELFRRGLGYSIHGLTCYRDANEPGLQAAFEFAMVHCFWRFLDRASAFGLGHLGNGSVFSATQAPLDMAASLEFEEFTRPFEISEETIGLDAIQAASEGALLMDHSSTLEHFREEIRGSQFFPRGLTAGAGHEEFQTERLLNEADNIVREAFNRSEFRVDAHLQKELQEHLDRAARELGAGSAMRIDKVKPAWPW